MNKSEIEKEIQLRFEFKINELLDAVKNACNRNWCIAAENMSSKHENYWEAFRQMKGMLIKERDMSLPYDNMLAQKRQEVKNTAVEKLSDRLLKKGSREYYQHQQLIASLVEEVQRNS